MAPYHFALLQLHRSSPKLSQQQIYEQSYWDVLQLPLQPLMDNLESATYETFEYDQAKYVGSVGRDRGGSLFILAGI